MLVIAAAYVVFLVPASLSYRTRRETGRQRTKRIKQFGPRKGESFDGNKRGFIDLTIMKDIRFFLLFIGGIFVM
ncbi:hypothetical protein BGX24_008059, partial [Mortierella sp. AD032]